MTTILKLIFVGLFLIATGFGFFNVLPGTSNYSLAIALGILALAYERGYQLSKETAV